MKKPINHIYFILLLATLSAIAPIAVDTHIPSIPAMASYFSVSIEKVELTLSIFLIGFAFGQIIGGIISDKMGRKKSALIGLWGFSIFSLILIFSPNIYMVWLFRFIQALFGGIIVVNASAAVRDVFHGQEAAKVFSLIGSVRSFAPLVAPAIGAFIIYFYSWHAIFIFLTLFSLLITFLVHKDFKETFTYVPQKILESYKLVFKNSHAIFIMLVLAFSFSGMFTLISKSSFIYIEHFNISPQWFPFYFGLNIVLLMVVIRLNIKLLNHFLAKDLIKFALITQLLVAFLFICFSKEISLPLSMLFISLYMALNGFIYGNATALALEQFPHNAGVASSVIGIIQFGLGAVISSLVVMFFSSNLTHIALSIFTLSSIALFLFRFFRKTL
jgi:DHA1 family bicyclomycin/chloramphenicol resistance-like MFS transporter